MLKITLKIDGMMCGMCESHINDAIRNTFTVRNVSSFHSKGTTVIITDLPVDEDLLRQTVGETGYVLAEIHTEPYDKKRFVLFGKRGK